MPRLACVRLVALAASLGLGRAAGAQTPAAPVPAPGPAATADYAFTVTERRPVTASSSLTVPASEFELRPLESGGQLIEAVPGALTAQHTGGGKAEQYFLRGFDADHGTDLLVYFDGVPINLRSHAHGQGYLDLHFVTPESIERIDAFKGPYHARFGDFATAAAVEYVPYAELPRSEATTEIGYWDTWRNVALLSPRFGPFAGDDAASDALVAFEAYRTDGPYDDDEDLRRFSLFARGSTRLSPSLVLSGHALGYGGKWHASGLIPDQVVDAGLLDRFGSLDPSEGGRSHRAQAKAQLDYAPSAQAHLTANAYVAYYDLDLYSNFTYELVDPVDGDGIYQKDDRVYAGGRVEWSQLLPLEAPALVRGGLEWRLDDARVELGTQTRRRETGISSDDDVLELSAAPYVEGEWMPLPWLRAIGGTRVEALYHDVDDRLPGGGREKGWSHRFLPKASLVATPFGAAGPWPSEQGELRALELFANFGRGFHSNDARTALDDPDGNLMTLATGAELGARTRLRDRATVALDAFWLGMQDELVYVGDEGTTESGGRTRRFGLELVTHVDLTEWLYARGDVAYTWARLVSEDVPLPQAPRLIAKSALGVRFGGFAAELSTRTLGPRRASEARGDPDLRGYTVLDLGMRYRAKWVEVGVAFENLADVRWESSEFFYPSCPPSEVGVDPRCPAAGGGEGVPDRHFTAGNPFNVRGWVSLRF